MNNEQLKKMIKEEIATIKKNVVKRWVATVEMYVYGKDEKEARQQAEDLIQTMDKQADNHPSLVDLVPQQFGKLGIREINIQQEDNFIKLNKMDDIEFVKNAWKMSISELKELLQFLENKYKNEKQLYSIAKGQTKSLYKHGILFYKSRIKFIHEIIDNKEKGIPIPDFAK
jgi:hypothetical protein